MNDQIRDHLLSEKLVASGPGDDEPLRACGMDSLGFLQLFDWLEETYGVVVDDSEMNPATVGTIARIVELVAGKLARKTAEVPA